MALSVDAVRIGGEWVRHAPHRSDLLGLSAEPGDGRWQRGDVVRGLYLADEPDTAVAERYRLLAELGLSPARRIPHDHHVWRLDLRVANLRTAERLSDVGLAPPRPGRRTWAPYQEVGEALLREGWVGLIAPSAARPSAVVVCLFAARWPPRGCEPVRALEVREAPPPPTGMTT